MKYGILLFIWGWIIVYFSVSHQGWYWLYMWPAIATLLPAIAYLGLGPSVFGKRKDGSMSLPAIIVLLPYLSVVWLVWYVRRTKTLTKEACYHEFGPGMLIGRRPFPSDLSKEIDLIVDLTCEFWEEAGVREGRTYRCFPTLDGHVPSQETLREIVELVVGWKGVSYIHCAEGHGRAALVSAAVMLEKGLANDVNEASDKLQALRPGVRMNRRQKRAVQKFGRP